jgi:hypothetical protein
MAFKARIRADSGVAIVLDAARQQTAEGDFLVIGKVKRHNPAYGVLIGRRELPLEVASGAREHHVPKLP